ncbi:MAG: hypothetical protein Kow0090_21530 [Myxococcota bacterium]
MFYLRAILAALLLATLFSCGGDDVESDVQEGEKPSGDDDDNNDDEGELEECPECSIVKVFTTLLKTINPLNETYEKPTDANPALPKYSDDFLSKGLGEYEFGEGEAHILKKDLVPDYDETEAEGRKSITMFFHATDIHITDDEAPIRIAKMDNTGVGGAIRPQDSYSTHGLDALIRTLKPFSDNGWLDFFLSTGDATDSALNTELVMFVDVMNGKKGFNPDTGEDDDPVPGPDNDSKDPFDALGLDIPWYWVYGNHDVLIVGNSPPTEKSSEKATGTKAASGTRDWRRNGDVTTGDVPSDENRWVGDFGTIAKTLIESAEKPGPKGHGLGEENRENEVYHYVAEPVAGIPIVLIVMALPDMTGGAEGVLFQKDIDDFLVPELEKVQAEGKLAIVASHFPSYKLDTRAGLAGDDLPGAVPGDALVETLNSYPNVIAYIAGHTHTNTILAHPAPEGKGEEYGYWEIVTASLLDFPQQARFVEIVYNGDGTGSIFLTLLDYASPEGSLAEMGRKLAIIDHVTGWSSETLGDIENRNAELVFKLSDEMTEKIESLGIGRDEILSQTSLKAEYELKIKFPGL